jgi:hypothetical protein
MLGDRVGYLVVSVCSTLLAMAGLLLIILSDGLTGTIVGVIVFAIGASSFWPPMDAYSMVSLR